MKKLRFEAHPDKNGKPQHLLVSGRGTIVIADIGPVGVTTEPWPDGLAPFPPEPWMEPLWTRTGNTEIMLETRMAHIFGPPSGWIEELAFKAFRKEDYIGINVLADIVVYRHQGGRVDEVGRYYKHGLRFDAHSAKKGSLGWATETWDDYFLEGLWSETLRILLEEHRKTRGNLTDLAEWKAGRRP